jgi:hypothetical protein
MTFDEFASRFRAQLPVGLVLENPGSGTSNVMAYSGNRVCYKRGDSRLYVGLDDLYNAYRHFAGRSVTTSDLKDFAPSIFDSAKRDESSKRGHNCHATFLFLALRQMGIVDEILGTGRSGNPFSVTIPPAEATSE